MMVLAVRIITVSKATPVTAQSVGEARQVNMSRSSMSSSSSTARSPATGNMSLYVVIPIFQLALPGHSRPGVGHTEQGLAEEEIHRLQDGL